MDAADKLRKFLKDKGLTQEKFETAHGISQAAVSAWVMRRKRPGLELARELQRITGIRAESWLDVVIKKRAA